MSGGINKYGNNKQDSNDTSWTQTCVIVQKEEIWLSVSEHPARREMCPASLTKMETLVYNYTNKQYTDGGQHVPCCEIKAGFTCDVWC